MNVQLQITGNCPRSTIPDMRMPPVKPKNSQSAQAERESDTKLHTPHHTAEPLEPAAAAEQPHSQPDSHTASQPAERATDPPLRARRARQQQASLQATRRERSGDGGRRVWLDRRHHIFTSRLYNQLIAPPQSPSSFAGAGHFTFRIIPYSNVHLPGYRSPFHFGHFRQR